MKVLIVKDSVRVHMSLLNVPVDTVSSSSAGVRSGAGQGKQLVRC